MSLKSVVSKLNSSYNSFTPSRSMSVTGAMLESLKFNLRFRFSLLGMVASLTKSSTLYNIAQQRYVDRKDTDRVEEETSFKTNVVNSVAALSRQVSLLQSVTEKNSAMINMIVNDLGYFKRERKINFLTDNALTLQNSSAFRVPLSSRTVKGQIEQINSQLQELKKGGVIGKRGRVEDTTQSKLLTDLGKVAAAGGIAAYLASQAAQGMGGDKTTQQIITALGGILGIASIPATSKIIEYVLKQSVPVLGKISRIGLAVTMAPEIIGGSIGRMGDRFSGKPVIERNYPPNPHPPGSVEYMAYEAQIETQKKIDNVKSTSLQMFDVALLGIASYYGAKALSKLPIGKALQAVKSRQMRNKFAGRESFKTRMGRYAAYNQKVERYDRLRAAQLERGVRPSSINLGIPPDVQRRMRAQTRIAGKTPSMVRRSTTAVRRVLGSKGSAVLNKMMTALKGSSLLRKIPVAAVPYIVLELGLMSSTQEDYDSGRIKADEYKENMTGSLTRLVNTVGVGVMGTIAGATVGTFIAGPLGTFGGALLGFGGSILASAALTESGSDSWVAEKLFGILFEDKMLDSSSLAAASGTSQNPVSAQINSQASNNQGSGSVRSIRNNNPGNLKYAKQREATGVDSGGFAIFPTPEAGLRAMEAQVRLDTQQRKETLYKFISEYAPKSENDTLRYVDFVSKQTGIQPYEQIPDSKIPEVMAAMIMMEGGNPAVNYFASASNGGALRMSSSGATLAASLPNQAVDKLSEDQAILKYFISLGANSVAQRPLMNDTSSVAQATNESAVAEGKADAALAAIKGTLQEVTRIAQDVKILQQKNNMDSAFPQVRPA
jgi:hypothetical protein